MKTFIFFTFAALISCGLLLWNPIIESIALHRLEKSLSKEKIETVEEAGMADLAESQATVFIQPGLWRYSLDTQAHLTGHFDLLLRPDRTFVFTVTMKKDDKVLLRETAAGTYVFVGAVLRLDATSGPPGLVAKPERNVVINSTPDSFEVKLVSGTIKFLRRDLSEITNLSYNR